MEYGMVAVSASDYERINHSVRTAVQFPVEAGGDYMATTVGTHLPRQSIRKTPAITQILTLFALRLLSV
jgi:hypothetical protein